MKKLAIVLGLGLSLAFGSVFAAGEAASAPAGKTVQQNKMTTCNKDAGDKKGDERKAFMKDCLGAKPVDKKAAQQEKMKTCNKDAGEKALKGDARKTFMKDCLSN